MSMLEIMPVFETIVVAELVILIGLVWNIRGDTSQALKIAKHVPGRN